MNSPNIELEKGSVFYNFINENKYHVLDIIFDGEAELIIAKYWSYHSKGWRYNIIEKYVFNWNVRNGMYYFK